jgi:uncharacterized membrane protein YbjE (DUF340 family)
MSIFEVFMLLCFGAAWPFSIYRSWTSGTTGGKSVTFLFVVLAGYIFGILNKLFYRFDNVIYLYILNFLMISADTAIWFRNNARDMRRRGTGRRV